MEDINSKQFTSFNRKPQILAYEIVPPYNHLKQKQFKLHPTPCWIRLGNRDLKQYI